jgi:hypothetical protein
MVSETALLWCSLVRMVLYVVMLTDHSGYKASPVTFVTPLHAAAAAAFAAAAYFAVLLLMQ